MMYLLWDNLSIFIFRRVVRYARYTWIVPLIKELDLSDNYSTLQPGIHGQSPGSRNWTYQTTTLHYSQVYLDSPLDQGTGLIRQLLYITARYTWIVHWIKELDLSDNYSTLQPGILGQSTGSRNWTYQTTTLRYNQVYMDSPLDQGTGLIRQLLYVTTRYTWIFPWIKELDLYLDSYVLMNLLGCDTPGLFRQKCN